MLALIAGTGDLPSALIARLADPVIVCALVGFEPSLDVQISFRIEHLGSFLQLLKTRDVTQICMAGAIRRPSIDPTQIDAATLPLVPRIQAAIAKGDDGALREVISIFEDHGFAVKAAHEIAPDLLPATGVLTKAKPSAWHEADAKVGAATITQMGAADIGQACVVRIGQVAAREDADGTDAMLTKFHDAYSEPLAGSFLEHVADTVGSVFTGADEETANAEDGILFKAPKPTQDRRVDLPVIGLQTAVAAAEAGLAGIVIEADGVMVLNLEGVISTLNMQGMFLWVRPSGAA